MGNTSNNNSKSQTKKQYDIDNSYYRPKEDIYLSPLANYRYFNKRVPYYSEEISLSENEQKLISDLHKDKIELTEFTETNQQGTTKVIIDTDIGTDWDDALAILYALNIPKLEILGITTNYGIPNLRASITRQIIEAYTSINHLKNTLPILEGASRVLGSHRELLIYGHEGQPFFSPLDLKNDLDMIMKRNQTKASEFISSMVKKYPNQVKIISIGIPTNIGLAIKNNKEIIPLIKEIIIMGCGSEIKTDSNYNIIDEIKSGNTINLYPNHNVSGDTIASKIIFDSCIRTKLISHSVSSKFWIEGKMIEYLRNKAEKEEDIKNPKTPEGAVGLLMKEWFEIRRQTGQCPHDPLTVNEAIFEGKDSPIIYARGRIILHEWAAFSTFIPQKDGPHFLGVKIKEDNNFIYNLEQIIMKV